MAETTQQELGEGRKFDDGKIDWDLLPLNAVEEIVRVLMFGAQTYDRNNWQQIENFDRRYYNAAMRHLTKHNRGEIFDPDSGLLCLAHAGCDIIFLLEKEMAKYKGIGDPSRFRNCAEVLQLPAINESSFPCPRAAD